MADATAHAPSACIWLPRKSNVVKGEYVANARANAATPASCIRFHGNISDDVTAALCACVKPNDAPSEMRMNKRDQPQGKRKCHGPAKHSSTENNHKKTTLRTCADRSNSIHSAKAMASAVSRPWALQSNADSASRQRTGQSRSMWSGRTSHETHRVWGDKQSHYRKAILNARETQQSNILVRTSETAKEYAPHVKWPISLLNRKLSF